MTEDFKKTFGDGKDAVALLNIRELMRIQGLECKPVVPEQTVEMSPPPLPSAKPADKGMDRGGDNVDPTQLQKKRDGNGRH